MVKAYNWNDVTERAQLLATHSPHEVSRLLLVLSTCLLVVLRGPLTHSILSLITGARVLCDPVPSPLPASGERS